MKKIISLCILFLSLNIYSENLSFFYIELGMSEKKLSKLLQTSEYKDVGSLPDNWKKFAYVTQKGAWIFYQCKIENGVVTEFIAIYGGKGTAKKQYASEVKDAREDYGNPIRMGFQRSLYKINNQFLQIAVIDNEEVKGNSFVMLTHTLKINSDKIIKDKGDMCLNSITNLYDPCKE